MADKVSIFNLALAHIGESASVVSPNETSEEAEACEAFYPQAKAKLLELHDWSFASRSQALAQLTLTDTLGWVAGYSLPSGCLRMQYVRQSGVMTLFPEIFCPDWDFEVRFTGDAKVLYTNCPSPVAGYIADVDEAYFSPSFIDALAWLLADYVAGERIKGKEGASFAQTCQKQFAASLALAKTLDGRNIHTGRREFRPIWIVGR